MSGSPEQGETGKTGLQGERGRVGETGQDGAVGARGVRGRAIALWQALAMFLLILLVSLTLAYKLERQQKEIAANAWRIADAQYQSCLGGNKILGNFNRQQERLAELEKQQTALPTLRADRIRVYMEGRILPLPVCRR